MNTPRGRLIEQVQLVANYAKENGWDVSWQFEVVDGCLDAVLLVGVRTDQHPDDPECRNDWGFAIAWGIAEQSNRMVGLDLDAKRGTRFVITCEQYPGRMWYGATKSYLHGVADPATWTNAPAAAFSPAT